MAKATTLCIDCGTSVPQNIGRGRRRLRCAECKRTVQHERNTAYRNGTRTCGRCDGPVPPRLHYCRTCVAAPKTVSPLMMPERSCATCKRNYQPTRHSQRYCNWTCRPDHGNRFHTIKDKRGSRIGGKYDRSHQQARKAAAARHKPTDLCTRCHHPLGPMSSNLHYDHADDGKTYLGFAHAKCNIKAGARKGHAASQAKRIPRAQSRAW